MKYSDNILLWMALLILPLTLNAAQPVNYTEADSVIFENYKSENIKHRNLPVNELIIHTAEYFTGKPYVAHTLEVTGGERLTVNLREFDCTTFVESCIALTYTIKSDENSFSDFCRNLQDIRYRDGSIEDYSSRLHYVSDWMYEHEKDTILRNMSKEMGGYLYNKTVTFMSSNINLYPELLNNKELQKKIKIIEGRLNKRGGYYVIGKEEIRSAVNTMKDGDLVIFSTSIPNLDFTHMGIIRKRNQQTGFIHASSSAKKVTGYQSLEEYCSKSKKCDGIVILRLNP